jgi:hypothetical protein
MLESASLLLSGDTPLPYLIRINSEPTSKLCEKPRYIPKEQAIQLLSTIEWNSEQSNKY